ncbi:nucleotidyltransferase family protein [Polaribacter sp.]|nr:nucleotidyltransferase family protein [Polaribacter sp.]
MEDKNKEAIEKQLQSNNIDWDSVVKVSTAHYVFPALYCNLQRANLLNYLPEELVTYMKYITKLNRERNEENFLRQILLVLYATYTVGRI